MFHFSTQKYHQVFRHLPACFLFLFLVFFANDSVFAQTSNLLQTKIDYQCEQKTTAATLIELSQLTEVSIGFDNETLDNQLRDYSFRHKSLSEILKTILVIHGQDFLFIDNGTILTKLKFKKQFIISGFIEDKLTGEALIVATVYDRHSGKGAVSNEFGFFSLKVNTGEFNLEASYLGFQNELIPISVERNHSIRISLEPSLSFEPVEVVAVNANHLSKELPFSNLFLLLEESRICFVIYNSSQELLQELMV